MFLDLLKKNRSYRSFSQNEEIGKDKLLEWIDGTRFTPSTMNLQPLKYRMVFAPDELEKVRPLTKWAAALKDWTIPPIGHHASAFIIILIDKNIAAKSEPFLKDVGICAHTILLQASEQGFGGCLIGNFSPEKIAQTLQIPDFLEPALIVALGKPDETITLTDADENGSTKYYRDSAGNHIVPKRLLKDIVIQKNEK